MHDSDCMAFLCDICSFNEHIYYGRTQSNKQTDRQTKNTTN